MRYSDNQSLPQISELLLAGGIKPAETADKYIVYPTPFRKSGAHSLIVTPRSNTWKDTGMHGLGDSRITVRGDVVAFCIATNLVSGRNEALDLLRDFDNGIINSLDYSSARRFQEDIYNNLSKPIMGDPQSVRILRTKSISDNRTVSFLVERNISIEIANEFCLEGIVEQGDLIRSIDTTLIFPNRTGGYLSISTWETKQIGHPDITFIDRGNRASCVVFSHQLDLLAYSTMFGIPDEDIIVMNHRANASDAITSAEDYLSVKFFIRRNTMTNSLLSLISQCNAFMLAETEVGWGEYDTIEDALKDE